MIITFGKRKIMEGSIGKYFIFFLITLPYLMPQYIETIIGDNSILSFGLNLISVTTIVFYFLRNYNYFIKSDLTSGLLIILFLAEYGVFLGSTISNHGPLRPALSHSLNVLLLCLVVSLVTRNETDLYYFLRTVQTIR